VIDGLAEFTATSTPDPANLAAPPAGVNAAAGAALIDITLATAGSDFNNVAINFVAGTANTADYDSVQKILTVNFDASSSTVALADIANAIDAHTVDGAAATALFSATEAAAIDIQSATVFTATDTGVTGGEVLGGDLVFQLNGADGAETFNFGSGTSASQIAAAVNLVSDSTGVSAEFGATGLVYTSTAYGQNALVAIDVIREETGGTFVSNLSAIRDIGQDIIATVNGIEAKGDGNTLSINTSTLDLTVTVDEGSNANFSFSITDGGALFQLGPDVTSNQQARLGIGSLSTGKLGGPSGRLYELGSGQISSLANGINKAAQVIDDVIGKVTGLRGRLGAFQATTLESNLVSLNATWGNLQEAESSIRDADFAKEAADLTRAQILVQSGTNVLSLANQNPQNVLALLR
jgi:flagellin